MREYNVYYRSRGNKEAHECCTSVTYRTAEDARRAESGYLREAGYTITRIERV